MDNKDPLNEMKKLAGLQLNEYNIAEAPKKSAAPADDGRQYYRDPGDGGPVVPLGTKSQAGPGLYGDEKGRFDKMPGDNTRFFSTPGPETAKPAPVAPAPAAKAPVVTKDQLDQFRKEVGNPNATLGQYMNQQKGLTARKGGANDPDVIQKNLNPDQQAYRPAAPTQPATPAPAKPAPAPATPSPTAPGGQFGPGSTMGMNPPAAATPPAQMSRAPGGPEINTPIPGFGPGAKPVPPPTGAAPAPKANAYDWGGGSSDGPAPKMKNPPSNPVSVPQTGRQDPYSMGGGLDTPPPPPPTTVPQAGRQDPYSMGGGRDAPKADVPKFMQTPDGPAPKMSTPSAAPKAAPELKVDKDNAGLTSDIGNLGTQYGITYNPPKYTPPTMPDIKPTIPARTNPDPYTLQGTGTKTMWDSDDHPGEEMVSDDIARLKTLSGIQEGPGDMAPDSGSASSTPNRDQPSQADREGLNKMFSNTAFTDKTGNVPLPPRRPADLGADTSPAVRDSYTDSKGNQHYVPNAPAYNADKKERDNVIKKMPPGIGMTTIESDFGDMKPAPMPDASQYVKKGADPNSRPAPMPDASEYVKKGVNPDEKSAPMPLPSWAKKPEAKKGTDESIEKIAWLAGLR